MQRTTVVIPCYNEERRFEPAMDDGLREQLVDGWRKALERTLLH